MARMVNCVKLGREAEGLDFAPYPGELGKRSIDPSGFRFVFGSHWCPPDAGSDWPAACLGFSREAMYSL